MNNKDYYRHFSKDGIPFFSSPLWLDFVCNENWDVSLIKDKNGEILASMPYVIDYIKKPGKILMPIHTKFLGPSLKIEKEKTESFIAEENRLLKLLEEQLPAVSYFRQSWNPYQTNCLPFLWKEYKAFVKYCYIINNKKENDAWNALNEDTRRLIRKAEENKISIIKNNDSEKFFFLLSQVFKSQGIKNPYTKQFLTGVSCFIENNELGYFSFAENSDGQAVACALVFQDNKTQYLFAGGADPYNKTFGGNSLLIWSLIKEAIIKGKEFNFLGSTIESKEKFIRSFGGQLYPYFDIIKDNRLIRRLLKKIKLIIKA